MDGNEIVLTILMFTMGFFLYIMWPILWPDADGKWVRTVITKGEVDDLVEEVERMFCNDEEQDR